MTVAVPARQAEIAALAEPVGDLIAHALAEIGVTTVFGVISIHNMPILDAIARQGRIRFVPARGEAGAMNMADAYARVSPLARRRHHQHRDGGRQRRRLAGRGADRRLAGAAHHLADRPSLDGPRSRRHPRRAAAGRHAAGGLQGLFPRLGRAHRGRHGGGGGARRADRAARSGLARDPDRRAARESGASAPCRRRPDRPAGRRSEAAR